VSRFRADPKSWDSDAREREEDRMARWDGDRERWIFSEGNRYEDMRHRGGGDWRGSERGWEDRGRERWTGGDRGDEWRAGSRGDEWRGGGRGDEWRGDREHGASGGEPGGREWADRGGWRGEWDRDREGRSDYGRPRERGGHGWREGWRGEGGSMGESSGPSFGAGGMYGGSGGMYAGSTGEGGMGRGGAGLGMGEYGGYGYGQGRGEPRGGWRDTSRDFGRDLRRHGEEEGPLERMGDRMREGWRKLTGHGPKGYKRSDERIREEVSERIARSGIDADDVEVKVEGGEVTLTGFVESRHDKRMLEDIADDVFGVDEVNNHLRMRREDRASQTFTAGQAQSTAQGTQPTAGQRGSQGTQPGRH
jgi:BON domain-containing protein